MASKHFQLSATSSGRPLEETERLWPPRRHEPTVSTVERNPKDDQKQQSCWETSHSTTNHSDNIPSKTWTRIKITKLE